MSFEGVLSADPEAIDGNRYRLFEAMAAANVALPVTSISGSSILHESIPRFLDANGIGLKDFAESRLGEIEQDSEEGIVVLPYKWTQFAARRECRPEYVAVARQILESGKDSEQERRRNEELAAKTSWNPAARLSCLSWLSYAICARQAGGYDQTAVLRAYILISQTDSTTALTLLQRMHEGLPGWPPVKDFFQGDYSRILGVIASVVMSSGGKRDYSEGDINQRLFAAFRNSRLDDVLALSETEIHNSLKDATPYSPVHGLRAYALARTGRMDEAWSLVTPMIPHLPSMTKSDQCELLHLLSEMMEREGRFPLAVRYLLQERALNPPTLDRRLHNRHHLYDTLLLAEPVDMALATAIAEEGFVLAREAADKEMIRLFAEILALRSCLDLDREKLTYTVDLLGGGPDIADMPSVILADILKGVFGDEEPEFDAISIERIRSISTGEDAAAAIACYLLGTADSISPEDRTHFLHRGATVAGGYIYESCSKAIFTEYWRLGKVADLKIWADANSSRDGMAVIVDLARVGIALTEADDSGVEEHLAMALACSDFQNLSSLIPGLWESVPESLRAKAIDSALRLLVGHVQSSLLPDGFQAESRLNGVTLIQSLNRIDYIFSFVDAPPLWIRDLFEWAASRAWDREDLHAAATSQEHLCTLLARIREVSAGELANAMGWLATLYKQLGRISEAELLYQRSIELGAGKMDKDEMGSVIERYGNLLHQVGDYEAAADMQWKSVRVRRMPRGLPDFPDSVEMIRTALSLEDITDGEKLSAWSLQAANLANCLKAAGFEEYAHEAIRCADSALERASNLLDSPEADYNFRAAALMLDKLRRHL